MALLLYNPPILGLYHLVYKVTPTQSENRDSMCGAPFVFHEFFDRRYTRGETKATRQLWEFIDQGQSIKKKGLSQGFGEKHAIFLNIVCGLKDSNLVLHIPKKKKSWVI